MSRTVASYIPKKFLQMVEDSYSDEDGIWIELKIPYVNNTTDTPTIHEWRIKDAIRELNNCTKLSLQKFNEEFN